jgi:hypothetical protein
MTGKLVSDTVAAASFKGKGPLFIEIDQAEGISQRLHAYDSAEIEPGTFGGIPPMPAEKLQTLTFPEYIIARKSYNEDKIAAFAKHLYASRNTLAYQLPGTVSIEAPSTDKDASTVVHPGAAAYLGDNQKTFFDRYGDAIFYSLLIIPALGSALAAIVGYFRAGTSTRKIRRLLRLLQTVKKARAVQSLEELDKLESEVDEVLGEAIYRAERGQLDETGLMSFSLAIEQARTAISDRRVLLVRQQQMEHESETVPLRVASS